MIHSYINALIAYGLEKGLIGEADRVYCTNGLINLLHESGADFDAPAADAPLCDILGKLCDFAVEKGIIPDTVTERDLFDTALMGVITPRPSEVQKHFFALKAEDVKKATDWYYSFSRDTNYIRTDRIAKILKWKYNGKYGDLDITVNLSKPEKDPKEIAAAKKMPQTGYPKCLLCRESEGYAGRLDFPARQNHRVMPISICGENWFMQYSPYVYYNEHCIVFNSQHTPMKIDRAAFAKLLSFVGVFPHYFVGSNADLPIVGGSILSHEHFQGGHYEFPMERAPIEKKLHFDGFDNVDAGIVAWPMSTIRLTSAEPDALVELADKILTAWRGYSDASAFIFAETDGAKHNTVTPIARRRGERYELDLVLRNNITTDEHPLGVFHPHAELHHIKKENIGLIEVMGLAVLPARLDKELKAVETKLLDGSAFDDELTEKHADWANAIKAEYGDRINAENVADIVECEVGRVFETVLEHAGVYKRTDEGRAAFDRFVESV